MQQNYSMDNYYSAVVQYIYAKEESEKECLDKLSEIMGSNADFVKTDNPVVGKIIFSFPGPSSGIPLDRLPNMIDKLYENGFTETNKLIELYVKDLNTEPKLDSHEKELERAEFINSIFDTIEKNEGRQINMVSVLEKLNPELIPDVYDTVIQRTNGEFKDFEIEEDMER